MLKLKDTVLTTAFAIRLSDEEIKAIKQAFSEVFGEGEVVLFGSRVDAIQKGGDIDLYLSPQKRDDLRRKKIDFLLKLDILIGERKIDVVISKDKNRPVEREALTKGVIL